MKKICCVFIFFVSLAINSAAQADSNGVFKIVEQMPQFPGGDDSLRIFLQKNIYYPPMSKETGIQGKVYIGFVIDELGKVTDVQIKRGVSKELDMEAMRVVKMMPNWIPGKENGKAVKVMYVLPIFFRLL